MALREVLATQGSRRKTSPRRKKWEPPQTLSGKGALPRAWAFRSLWRGSQLILLFNLMQLLLPIVGHPVLEQCANYKSTSTKPAFRTVGQPELVWDFFSVYYCHWHAQCSISDLKNKPTVMAENSYLWVNHVLVPPGSVQNLLGKVSHWDLSGEILSAPPPDPWHYSSSDRLSSPTGLLQ